MCLDQDPSSQHAIGVGRASVPPERLLKALSLISLYSIRSERAFCQELDYNLLYRWFLDIDLMEPSFSATALTKNRRRLLRHEVGRKLFQEVVYETDRRSLRRPPLSTRVRGVRRMAPYEPTTELLGQLADEAAGSRRDASRPHRPVRQAGRLRLGVRIARDSEDSFCA